MPRSLEELERLLKLATQAADAVKKAGDHLPIVARNLAKVISLVVSSACLWLIWPTLNGQSLAYLMGQPSFWFVNLLLIGVHVAVIVIRERAYHREFPPVPNASRCRYPKCPRLPKTLGFCTDHFDSARACFPGSKPFTEESPFFFGRDGDIARLLSALRNKITVLVGPAGSGKSSLIQSGINRRLRTARNAPLPIYVDCRRLLADCGGEWSAFAARLDQAANSAETGRGKLVELDQFEQLLVHAPHLVESLFDWIRAFCAEGQQRALIAVRRDDVDSIDAFYGLVPDLISNRTRLAFFTKTDAAKVIAESCNVSGISLPPALRDAILDDLCRGVEHQVNPVEMGILLFRLFSGSASAGLDDYIKRGRRDGCLLEFVNEAIGNVPPSKRNVALDVLEQLSRDTKHAMLVSISHVAAEAQESAEVVREVADSLERSNVTAWQSDTEISIVHDFLLGVVRQRVEAADSPLIVRKRHSIEQLTAISEQGRSAPLGLVASVRWHFRKSLLPNERNLVNRLLGRCILRRVLPWTSIIAGSVGFAVYLVHHSEFIAADGHRAFPDRPGVGYYRMGHDADPERVPISLFRGISSLPFTQTRLAESGHFLADVDERGLEWLRDSPSVLLGHLDVERRLEPFLKDASERVRIQTMHASPDMKAQVIEQLCSGAGSTWPRTALMSGLAEAAFDDCTVNQLLIVCCKSADTAEQIRLASDINLFDRRICAELTVELLKSSAIHTLTKIAILASVPNDVVAPVAGKLEGVTFEDDPILKGSVQLVRLRAGLSWDRNAIRLARDSLTHRELVLDDDEDVSNLAMDLKRLFGLATRCGSLKECASGGSWLANELWEKARRNDDAVMTNVKAALSGSLKDPATQKRLLDVGLSAAKPPLSSSDDADEEMTGGSGPREDGGAAELLLQFGNQEVARVLLGRLKTVATQASGLIPVLRMAPPGTLGPHRQTILDALKNETLTVEERFDLTLALCRCPDVRLAVLEEFFVGTGQPASGNDKRSKETRSRTRRTPRNLDDAMLDTVQRWGEFKVGLADILARNDGAARDGFLWSRIVLGDRNVLGSFAKWITQASTFELDSVPLDSLRRVEGPELYKLLQELTVHPREMARRAAATALGHLDGATKFAVLVKMSDAPENYTTEVNGVSVGEVAITALRSNTLPDTAADLLAGRLEATLPKARHAALDSCSHWSDVVARCSTETIARLKRLTRSKYPEARCGAVMLLSEPAVLLTEGELRAAIEDPSRDVRAAGVRGLVKLQGLGARNLLIHERWDVRKEAAKAMAKVISAEQLIGLKAWKGAESPLFLRSLGIARVYVRMRDRALGAPQLTLRLD
jgi:hypothetical protein